MSPDSHNGILPGETSVPNTSSSSSAPVIHDSQKLTDPEQGLELSRTSQQDIARCETLNDPSSASFPPTFDEKSSSSLDPPPTDPQDEPEKISRFTQIRSSKHFLSFTVALAVFVDLLCYGIIMPLTPFIVADLGLKSTANGALIACYAVGLLISSPVAGILSDKMANRRTPMIVGLMALLLSTVLFMEGLKHYWLLLVARFAAGLAGGTMMTLGFALLSDTYPSNQLGAEMGKIMIGQSLGLMAGPPLGGLLQDNIGPKAPYVLCLVLIAIDLVARLLIIEPRSAKVKAIRKFQKQQQKEQKEQGLVQQPSIVVGGPDDLQPSTSAPVAKLTTMSGLLKNKRLLTGLIVSFTQAFLIAALEPVLPLYLSERFQLSPTQIGVIFLAISLPTFVSPVAGWFSDKHGAKIMCATAIIFCIIFVVIFGIPGLPLWAIILALVGIGATCAIYITPVLGEISAVVRVTGDGDGFARAFALFNMCFSLGMTAGPLLGSLIYQETSMLWTCILIAAVTVVIVPLVFLYMGGKAQKERDQAQYEQDMQEQDLILSRIQEEKRRKQELQQETPSSHTSIVDQKV